MYIEIHTLWIFVGCACSIWILLEFRLKISGTFNQEQSQTQRQHTVTVTVTATDTTSACSNDSFFELDENGWKQATVSCVPLTSHISCYQNVTFIVKSRRPTNGSAINKTVNLEDDLQLTFFAFDRIIELALGRHMTRQLSITLVGAEKRHRRFNHTFDNYFSGFVKGEPSNFYGIYDDGILDGILELNEETYYLEPMDRYFREIEKIGKYRLVVYREKDIAVSNKLCLRRRQTGHNREWIQQGIPDTSHETPKHAENRDKFEHLHRQKREFATPYRVCELKIIVDYNFYNIYCSQSIKRVVHEVAYSVSASDSIFRTVDFDSNGVADNIGFTIAEILIFENDTFPEYYLHQSNDPHTLLEDFTRYDFSQNCLGVLMTYRDFRDGIVGLAYQGTTAMYIGAGGMCEKRVFSFNAFRSYNALLVTPVNSNFVLPRRQFALTLAHELGHSFGAEHDKVGDKACCPNDKFGMYLMNERTAYYQRPNNEKFSSCSLLRMGPVVARKGSCLKVYDAHSLCGNFLIDPGEECDCGPTADTCQRFDSCCVAPERGKPGCRVPRELGKYCSPQTSQCCTQNCTTEPNPVVCRASTECSKESRCDTTNVECPDPVPLADGKLCRGGTRVCRQGLCEVSRCVHYGWEDCQCRTTENELCELCCKPTNATQAGCVPAYKLADDDDIVRPIYRRLGELCDDNRGYCSKKGHCYIVRHTNYNDVFQAVFQLSTREQIKYVVSNYWYYVVVGLVSLVFFFNFLHAFYHRTESSDALAYRSANLAVMWQVADSQYLTIEEQLQQLNKSYETKLVELEQCELMDLIVAVGRMQNLFPKTPQHVVVEAVSKSGCEEYAVRYLLLKGYALDTMACVREEMQNQTSTEEGISSIKRTDEVRSDIAITITDIEETSGETVIVKQTPVTETLVEPFTSELTPVEEPSVL